MIQYPLFFPLFFFILGACIGSFLNVVIFRLPAGQSIVSPPSHCPQCKTAIPFYLNVPILSYILLRGKCRFCKHPFSLRYPLVELLCGLTALLIFIKFGLSLETGYWIVFAAALIAVSFIDIDHQIIPDVISLPGIVIFASSSIIVPGMSLVDTILGILAGGGILWAVAWGYYLLKGISGMGGGDIKLLAMIGAALGVQGIFFTLFAGSLLGTAGGIITMIAEKKGDFKLKIPFGPFLSAGALIYLFWGDQLVRWYFGLLAP